MPASSVDRLAAASHDGGAALAFRSVLKSRSRPSDAPSPILTAMPTAAQTSTVQPASNPTAAPGSRMPVGDITDANRRWHQIFADDFTTNVPVGSFPGAVYRSRWGVYPDGRHDTSGNGTYYPSKVLSVGNSALNMYLHTELINGIPVHLVAAPVPHLSNTTRFAGQTYGRYSVRYDIDPVPGYKTAWLLWPDSNQWPSGGEIDFPEGNLSGTISAFMHYASSAGGRSAFSHLRGRSRGLAHRHGRVATGKGDLRPRWARRRRGDDTGPRGPDALRLANRNRAQRWRSE